MILGCLYGKPYFSLGFNIVFFSALLFGLNEIKSFNEILHETFNESLNQKSFSVCISIYICIELIISNTNRKSPSN